jgi:Fe2+ or Zn2+ uptake regulation protein/O6-methylguanine-DNA--protein-cysteine methyltransferase
MNVTDPGERLRAHGLRVTPQRRAILSAFGAGAAEHLSADEVHARAAAAIPEIGRGTVYSTLAELTELGLLSAVGAPEPVRYESNTAAHQHFRCRLCLRLFDVAIAAPQLDHLHADGFAVEGVAITAEGICAECRDYDGALSDAARAARAQPSGSLPAGGVAAAAVATPLGPVLVGATAAGVIRVVFDSHGDASALRDAIRGRRGGPAARAHVAAARAAVEGFFAGEPESAEPCTVDWDALPDAATLRAVQAVPRGRRASYDTLDTPAGAAQRGHALGVNPVVLLVPCHRVTRGRELPSEYVGGLERRLALLDLERAPR